MWKYRILAVDDNTKVAEMASNFLHGEGAETDQDTPEAAKQMCKYLDNNSITQGCTFMVMRVWICGG